MAETVGQPQAGAASQVQSNLVPDSKTHELTLSQRSQYMLGAAMGGLVLWSIAATTYIALDLVGEPNRAEAPTPMVAAFEARIAALTEERDRLRADSYGTTEKLTTALDAISDQQRELMALGQKEAELKSAVTAAQEQLAAAVEERNAAEEEASALSETLAALGEEKLDREEAMELTGALDTVTGALEAAVRDRDNAKTDLDRLETEIASLELTMEIASERQEQMVQGLEDAVEMSFKPLEEMFANSGLDVDNLVGSIRSSYTGLGGLSGPVTMSARSFDDPELTERFSAVMDGMDKMNLMRIAATKVPYAMPVRAAHRFTSGFGSRRDPKTGGRRAHNGIDLAAPRGTPILATAEGVVVHASRQSGYGKLVKIRHEFGFETLYAHLNAIHVKVGDRIARGDHIGDMGTTGRSTGVHLHYEVRIGGKPVNPMTFIKAAKDVF